jgi:outer membrane protein assembly factor BamD
MMKDVIFSSWRPWALLAALVTTTALLSAACVRPVRMPQPGEQDPDRYLFERGTEALEARHWLEAREYFQRLVDQFPQSQYRQEARLGIGDAYLGEGGYDTLVIAAEKFREFLRYFPLNERADYAQYKVAVAESEQMLSPERDQTATVTALREIEAFLQLYPNSKYTPEVLALRRQARDRLSDSEFRVGVFYYRSRWYRGALPRFQAILKNNPEYIRRDAVYYHLAESYLRLGEPQDAMDLFTKLVEEFKVSDYLDEAHERIAELTRMRDSARQRAAGAEPVPATVVESPPAEPVTTPVPASATPPASPR